MALAAVILPHSSDRGVGTGGSSSSMDEGDGVMGTVRSDDGGIVTNNGGSTSNGGQVTVIKHGNLNNLKNNR